MGFVARGTEFDFDAPAVPCAREVGMVPVAAGSTPAGQGSILALLAPGWGYGLIAQLEE